jgi:acetyltransferase-like isoleucine patch superfamily enzyme
MREQISATVQDIAHDVVVAPSASVIGDEVYIGPGAVIEDDVKIQATRIQIGYGVVIQKRCELGGLRKAAELIQIGDFSVIGHDTTVLVPTLVVGDYTAIHNHVLINGYKPCRIGHNSFIGQHSVLNATEALTIGNNFRMALNGYIWTHAESGELLEGCTFYQQSPTVVEDNVWLTGCNISISPGVRLGNGSIILMGSVVTKDTLPRHCYGGVPARDLTERMKPYRDLSMSEKVAMMKEFVREFQSLNSDVDEESIVFYRDAAAVSDPGNAKIVILEESGPVAMGKEVSVFSIANKSYIKQRTEIEERFMRFLVGARARFIPVA